MCCFNYFLVFFFFFLNYLTTISREHLILKSHFKINPVLLIFLIVSLFSGGY